METIHIYQSAPNQKCIITRKTVSDEDHLYGISNIQATLRAARTLSDRAYKLYSRMNLHQDKYGYALSPTEIRNSIGMSDKRYREAVKELIAKGYLVQNKTRRNLYDFYELPEVPEEAPSSVQADEISEREPIRTGYMASMDRWRNDGTAVKLEESVTASAGHPGENGSISRPMTCGFPAASGSEILQDNTFNKIINKTTDITFDSTKAMELQRRLEEDYRNCQALLAKRREEEVIYEQYEDEYELVVDDINSRLEDSWYLDDDEDLPF